MWWPKGLRRPSDVWARLPLPARMTRFALSALVVMLPLTMLLRDRVRASSPQVADVILFGVEAALVIAASLATLAGFWWAYRRGLKPVESARFLFGATTAASGWHEAAAAQMLLPVRGRTRLTDENDPADICRAIKETLPALVEESTETRRTAEEIANSAFRSIKRIDEELAALDRNANQAEVDRLSARLASLGEPGSRDTTEQLELRALLQQQLEVIRRMRDSQHAVRDGRKQHLALLQELWSAVSAAGDSAGHPSSAQLAQRVTALAAKSRDDQWISGKTASG